MSFEFEYNGGVARPTEHTNEKFMLFFIVGGKEIPLYSLQRDGLVHSILGRDAEKKKFSTGMTYLKVFMGQQGFGIPRRFHSFYLKFLDGPAPEVTIRPFSGEESKFYFRGKVSFLNKEEAMAILEEETSRVFLQRQGTISVDLLRQLVSVDRSDIRKNVRKVRLGGDRSKRKKINQ